jgi:hypothetical protein
VGKTIASEEKTRLKGEFVRMRIAFRELTAAP